MTNLYDFLALFYAGVELTITKRYGVVKVAKVHDNKLSTLGNGYTLDKGALTLPNGETVRLAHVDKIECVRTDSDVTTRTYTFKHASKEGSA